MYALVQDFTMYRRYILRGMKKPHVTTYEANSSPATCILLTGTKNA